MRLMVFLGLGLGLAGCVVADDPEATATGSTGSAMPSTGAASSGSSGSMNFDAYCEAFTDADACRSATEASCVWSDVTRYDPNTCEVLADLSSCFWTPIDVTDPGCGAHPGCEQEVGYQEVDGTIELSEFCGGPRPDGFEPCTYVSEGVFEPAGCSCACMGNVGSTSDGGSGSGSDTSTGGTSSSTG